MGNDTKQIKHAGHVVNIISSMIVCMCAIDFLTMFHSKLLLIYSKGIVTLVILGILATALFILRQIRINHFFLILCMILYDFVSTIITGGGIGSVMIQCYIIFTIIAISNCRFDQKRIKFLLLVILAIWVSWVVRGKDYYYAFERGEQTMNSNTVAEIVLFSYMFFTICRKAVNKRIVNSKCFLFLFTVVTAWVIWQCRSRTTIIAFFLFLTLNYMIPKEVWRKKVVILFSCSLMLAGIMFPLVYLSVGQNKVLQDFVYHFTGRTLYTGREIMWKEYYDGFGNSISTWLFGQGSHTDSITHIHNSYLLVMLNFGIIGIIFYMCYMLMNVISVMRTVSDFQLKCIFMFWCFQLIGWMETILLWNPTILICYIALAMGQNETLRKMYSKDLR